MSRFERAGSRHFRGLANAVVVLQVDSRPEPHLARQFIFLDLLIHHQFPPLRPVDEPSNAWCILRIGERSGWT